MVFLAQAMAPERQLRSLSSEENRSDRGHADVPRASLICCSSSLHVKCITTGFAI
jgi:hypothetical protein